MRNIRSSRWANDANFPADEGEFSDAPAERRIQKWRKKISLATPVEMRAHKKSISPEFGEVKREGSEGTRARSSESDEGGTCSRSSSRNGHSDNDLDMKDNIEINKELNNGGTSLSHADTESEDECDSRDFPEPAAPPPPPQISVDMLQGCRSVDDFERLNKIDEGTYGVVFRAKDKKTGEIVALKKVKMEKEREGFPLTSLREINILLSFDHPSIVDVKEVVVGSTLDKKFMVMEYMEHDLKALMETKKQPFSQSEVKCLMLQLLEGVKYLHNNWVLHRDLKTSNLLLNNRGHLNFFWEQNNIQLQLTCGPWVVSWLSCYRTNHCSMEKQRLIRLTRYSECLAHQMRLWPGFSKLPGVKANFIKHPYNLLGKKFPATSFVGSPVLSDAGFDLLNKLLTYVPDKRITAADAIKHQWFREVPLPKSKDFMPTFPAQHAQDRRMRRIMKSPDPLEEQRRKELLRGGLGTGGLFD